MEPHANSGVKNALDGAIDIVAPLNPDTGFLSTDGTGAAAAFNGGYFLWVEEETDDPFYCWVKTADEQQLPLGVMSTTR